MELCWNWDFYKFVLWFGRWLNRDEWSFFILFFFFLNLPSTALVGCSAVLDKGKWLVSGDVTFSCFVLRFFCSELIWTARFTSDSLLSQHIVELLRQQQFLEIFLEGTRSRSGKTSCARAGLLSVIVDTLSSNTIPDILVIPVGISYDRIIEGHYNGEQLVRSQSSQGRLHLLSFAFILNG